MERVSLPRQQLSDSGLAVAYSMAVVDGHAVENDRKLILHVKNDSEADIEVVIRTGFTWNGLKLSDRVVTVPHNGAVFIGPFDKDTYNQPSTNQIHIDYSSIEGVSIAALQL